MMKITIRAGTSMNQAAAKRNGSGDTERDDSTSAGSVRSVVVRMTAAKVSFHDSTKVKMAAAAMPGSARGMTTLAKAANGVQPSVCAASSRSLGTETKMLEVIRMVNGSARAVCMSA